MPGWAQSGGASSSLPRGNPGVPKGQSSCLAHPVTDVEVLLDAVAQQERAVDVEAPEHGVELGGLEARPRALDRRPPFVDELVAVLKAETDRLRRDRLVDGEEREELRPGRQ